MAWKCSVSNFLQFLFNCREVQRKDLVFTCKPTNPKRSAGFCVTIPDSYCVDFKLLWSFSCIIKNELSFGQFQKMLCKIRRTSVFTPSVLMCSVQVGISVTGMGRTGRACRIKEPSPRTSRVCRQLFSLGGQ